MTETITTLPEPTKAGYLKVALLLTPVFSVLLLIFAFKNLGLVSNDGYGYVRLAVLALASYTVAYAIFRMAIEKGAVLAAAGISQLQHLVLLQRRWWG